VEKNICARLLSLCSYAPVLHKYQYKFSRRKPSEFVYCVNKHNSFHLCFCLFLIIILLFFLGLKDFCFLFLLCWLSQVYFYSKRSILALAGILCIIVYFVNARSLVVKEDIIRFYILLRVHQLYFVANHSSEHPCYAWCFCNNIFWFISTALFVLVCAIYFFIYFLILILSLFFANCMCCENTLIAWANLYHQQ
jgi:hypothetical protein